MNLRDDEAILEEARLERQTSEGAQELQPRPRTTEVVITGGAMWPEDPLDDTMEEAAHQSARRAAGT